MHFFCVFSSPRALPLALAGSLLVLTLSSSAEAHGLFVGNTASGASSQNGSSSASATSQTATAATTATAQAYQAAVTARQAQDSLFKSALALQALQKAQLAAQQSSSGNVLTTGSGGQTDGLGVGLLNPQGGVPTTQTSSIQIVDLGSSGKNQLSLSNGGSVTLPNGTSGTDQVSFTGAGSVTTTGGTVTATSGSLTTSTGGTLAASNGGSISLTAGSGTLSSNTSATITSTLAGTITLPGGGGTMPLTANQTVTLPAGSSVSFAGSGTGTVSVSGAGTMTLAGAGTLALTSPAAGVGGTITSSNGTTSFTNGAVSSLPSGSTVNLAGSGTINFTGSGSDVLPVIVQPTTAQTIPAFSTTGTVVSTTGYNLPASWTGVGALSQSLDGTNNQTIVTITQSQPQALLNWTTFNIGKNTTLDFDQSAGGVNVGDWIAINRILDSSLAPTQILGSIQASGQVYVVNQNGIIFTGSAQVNTHALVASTLPINSNLVTSGLLENLYGQFLFSSMEIPTLNGSTPYNPATDPDVLQNNGGVAPSGNIVVDEGAYLNSPGSAEGVGGKIALIAPNVDNEGTLSSPDGQVIIAAGQQVGFAAHPSSDASLRGLDVSVGAGGGTATNGVNGYIYAPEADVTMTGATVDQFGVINGGTSVSLNGRIDLLAMTGLSADPENNYIIDSVNGGTSIAGTVDLGPNSLTEILPDYSSSVTQVGTTLALPSQVYVEAGTFHMENEAQLIAPNAAATFSIGIANTAIATTADKINGGTAPLPENTGAATGGGGEAIPSLSLSTLGQVILDPLSTIDVSGSNDVSASVTENIVSAELTEAVLADSPLQETGPLRGQTVTVDVSLTGTNSDGSTWYGSPIGDLSGYANLIEHTVGELTIAGGSVTINTNGSVVQNPTSTINVSGGSIDYQGATVQTTEVVTSGGQVINISDATPNQVYQGIEKGFNVSSPKFGTSQTTSNTLESGISYDPGYVEGGNGGSITITAPTVALNGSLYGNTTAGARQQSVPPAASSFSLSIVSPGLGGGNPPVENIVVQPAADAQTSSQNTIYLSPDLFGVDGFANASIDTGSGAVTIAADSTVSTLAGGSLNLTAANININGQIYVPSGTINLNALTKDPLDLANGNSTSYNPSIGNIDLSSGAEIATSGLSFDEMSDVTPGTLPFSVNGGTITLSSAVTSLAGATPNAAASIVDASGGAARSAAGKIYDGKGGKISITGSFAGAEGNADGQVLLDGTLSAYGIGQGGSLTIKAPAIQVGGVAQSFPASAIPLVLPGTFFSQGGFSSYSLTGLAGVQILSSISPVLTEEQTTNGSQLGVQLVSSAELPQYPVAPVNLSFSAPGTSTISSSLNLATGVDIVEPPTSAVSLTGKLVDILGDLTAPGGSISITGDSTSGLTGSINTGAPDVTVYLGPGAKLDVSGTVITTPTSTDYQSYTVGEVLNGGTITITGNIVGDTSASLLANGAAGTLDVLADTMGDNTQTSAFAHSSPYVSETIGSNGGSITLNGLEELYFGGSVSAAPGNQTAIGGTLTVGSGIVASTSMPPNAGYPELFVQQSGTFPTGAVTLGSPLTGVSQTTGGGYFTVDQFASGDFGSLVLNGNVDFLTSVTIKASQEVEIIPDSENGTIFANPATNPTIDISAPYIAIGATTLNIEEQTVSDFAPSYAQVGSSSDVLLDASPLPGLATPTYGAATLSLNATDLIDVGFLSLQDIGTTNFSVPGGDIRGGGLFYAAGTINLTAGQIYTPTAASFTIAAFDAGAQLGTVNIYAGTARPLPLSAAGTINVYGSIINQDGVLEAPFGTINLGALPNSTSGLTPVLAGINFLFNPLTEEYEPTPDYTQLAPVTQQLTLGTNSITSVSGVSSTGQALDLPYGTISNGTDWIAPNGSDITAGGLPAKAVNLEGDTVNDLTGSLVNLTGGGDLFAYQFVPGVGGMNDILNNYKYSGGEITTTPSTSFAILPDYGINYAPIDLSVTEDADQKSVDYPYANSSITSPRQVGNQIYLSGDGSLPAGTYTILPARYALLPGAYLVTPVSGSTPTQASLNPGGSVVMGGYTLNSLNSNQQIVPDYTAYEVDSPAVVSSRAEYTVAQANTFLSASATANNQPVPRLPVDAGQLVLSATANLEIAGGLSGTAGPGGIGSSVDIGSPDDIYIVSNTGDTPTLDIPAGTNPADYTYLTLSADELDNFGADSLLIGGIRSTSSSATTINPTTNAIYVQNNSTTPLTGNEIILASNQTLTLASGADIAQSGGVSDNESNLTVGSASNSGSGDGTLIRVTGDPNAQFNRLGVNTADTTPNLAVMANASISGVAVTLDSSSGAFIDPTAALDKGVAGQALVLQSGAISLQIDPSVSISSATGLVISNSTLQTLESSVQRLELSSYSSVNLYGAGTVGGVATDGQPVVQNLTLEGAGIFGYDSGGGTVTFNAQNVTIDNSGDQALPSMAPSLPTGGQSNALVINADTIYFGANTFAVNGYSNVTLAASDNMLLSGTGGFNAQGALILATPMITASAGAAYAFNAQSGALALAQPSQVGAATVTGGLGAVISFTGSNVTVANTVSAPSGTINVTANTGNIEVQSGGDLDALGQAITFGNQIEYTNGGQVNLTSVDGGVTLDSGSVVNVSAQAGGGNAGAVSISAPTGTISVADKTLEGTAGAGGAGGAFNARMGLAATLSSLTAPLDDSGFQSLEFDLLTGSVTVDGAVGAAIGQTGLTSFSLTAEQGGITVDNAINASGSTGGTIDLYANEGVTLTGNADLTVAAQQLNDASEGGTIDIETLGQGGAGNNAIDIEANSTIDLSVAGGPGGVLHLRAPQTPDQTSLLIDKISGNIINPTSIIAEGFAVFQSGDGTIDSVEGNVESNVATFGNNTGAVGISGSITDNLVGGTVNSSFASDSVLNVMPGEEIINPSGSLTLENDWDLSSLRTSSGEPGILTIRASGNLVFNGSLTDGFAYNGSDSENVAGSPYTWDVISGPSWSYRLVAGALFTSGGTSTTNYGEVQSLAALGLNTNSLTNASVQAGSLLLGQGIPYVIAAVNNYGTQTSQFASTYAQLIRTGNGNITIDTGGSVDLLNQLATIYTAGSLAPTISGFSSPTGTSDTNYENKVYGTTLAPAPQYTAQYTEGGGNITINAQQDIAHLTTDANGNLVPDTTWQFPTNWLYRRGATSSTDVFDTSKAKNGGIETTTWWVDFSNFFEGIGALGGGNVDMNAGGNIVNVDADVPTNARMPSNVSDIASNLVELGGGDLSVVAGGTILGGTYYVEKGTGTIDAGTITSTGDTVRISPQDLGLGENTPLPLTLFVGDSSFTVQATNDLTIGSTVNAFLLPQGIGNNFNNESIFSTYGNNSSVSLSSLLGSIEVDGSESNGSQLPGSLYDAYLSNASPGGLSSGFNTEQSLNGTPWTLTLDPNLNGPFFIDNVANYSTFFALSPPIFDAKAFSGDIQYDSDQLLAPASRGTLQLLAAGSVNGAYNSTIAGQEALGVTANITILDDNPNDLPSVVNPFGLGKSTVDPKNNPSIGTYINNVFSLIGETPSYADQTYQTLESYHTSGLLHADTTTPVEIATINGDIGNFTLISPEATQISSGLDLQDVSLYLQNNSAGDISVVAANRDITLFDPNSTALFNLGAVDSEYLTFGDLQISGPGTLEVLAGRNLNLGEGTAPGAINAIGTGLGITSIGNSRNPYLPFGGANIFAASGFGDSSSLGSGTLNYAAFDSQFLDDAGAVESARYLPDLGSLLGLAGATNSQIWNIFSGTSDSSLTTQELQIQAQLTPESRDALSTTIFYDVLRDAGEDHNDPSSPNYGQYTEGFAAINTLFPTTDTLTFAPSSSSNFTNNETVTIGAEVYTFKSTLTGAANEVLIGSDAATSLANLAGAIDASSNSPAGFTLFSGLASVSGLSDPTLAATTVDAAVNAGLAAGVTYGLGTVANPAVGAVASSDSLSLYFPTSTLGLSSPINVLTRTTDANASWSAPALNYWRGNITLTSREIKTTNGGDINLLAPGGSIEVGLNNNGTQAVDQGILTVDGGNISTFTRGDVDVGTSRIFTLHGGNIIGWSTLGGIDAGASSRTVQSAPPTLVDVDTQSANVETDLAGLATGGGIGVLETVVGAPPGDVSLIAPNGTINAGDAGIRASGNISIAAAQVLNAGNIQSGGSTSGVPTTAAPNISANVAASSAAGSSQSAASQLGNQQQPSQTQEQDIPSIISVEVIGYGGGDDGSAYYSPTSSSTF